MGFNNNSGVGHFSGLFGDLAKVEEELETSFVILKQGNALEECEVKTVF